MQHAARYCSVGSGYARVGWHPGYPQIIACSPGSRVIILTSFGEDDKVLPAIRAGAKGYLLKDIPPNELIQAVREAFLGKVQLHSEIARKLMSPVAANAEPSTSYVGSQSKDSLTEREQKAWI